MAAVPSGRNQDGDRPLALRSVERTLASRYSTYVDEVQRSCELSDAQKKKLLLAGNGDIKHFQDRVAEARRVFEKYRHDQNSMQLIFQETQPLAAKLRAGLLCGPHDNVFRLPWWVRRIGRGGEVLAPGDPDRTVQLIDARDLAAWIVDLGEERRPGTFNATLPSAVPSSRTVKREPKSA